jgi:hypothetical protein
MLRDASPHRSESAGSGKDCTTQRRGGERDEKHRASEMAAGVQGFKVCRAVVPPMSPDGNSGHTWRTTVSVGAIGLDTLRLSSRRSVQVCELRGTSKRIGDSVRWRRVLERSVRKEGATSSRIAVGYHGRGMYGFLSREFARVLILSAELAWRVFIRPDPVPNGGPTHGSYTAIRKRYRAMQNPGAWLHVYRACDRVAGSVNSGFHAYHQPPSRRRR